MDHVLKRSWRAYAGFLADVWERGVLEPAEPFTSEVGVLFAKKKDGRWRLIFDSRAVNQQFREPDKARLCSGEGLGDMALHGNQQLWSCEGNVDNCCYQYLLPEG